LETPKQPLTVKEHKAPGVTNPHKVKFAMSSRTKRMGESRWNWQGVRSTSPYTKDPSSDWRRCDFGCEMWIECPCLEFGQLRNHGESRSNEERERDCVCGVGYLKDPQKLAAVGRKEPKTGWTGFHQEDLGSLIYSARDSTGFKIGWARTKSGWTDFQKISAYDFSDNSDCQTGQSRGGRETVQKPVEPVSGPVEPVFEAEEQVLKILKWTKVELLWGVRVIFQKAFMI
jgi:hypothetical protein